MSESQKSYRQILKSSAIIGGGSVIGVAVGLFRTKVVAILLGPAGVGLIGLLSNIMGTAATISGFGLGMVGTRQIAEAAANNSSDRIVDARRALFWGTAVLAMLGAGFVWLFREAISVYVFGSRAKAFDVGVLSIGVALSIVSTSQAALLNGLRRIGDLAKSNVISAVLSTIIGIGILLLWREAALPSFVVAVPVSGFIAGYVFVSRLPRIVSQPTQFQLLLAQWKTLARLGFAFMLSGLVLTFGQLIVRTFIQKRLGVDALGYFQASWVISMTYTGLVLGAMGADFYPRLTGTISDHEQANRLVNEQTEVALLLAGPVILAMLSFAPVVISLLYASSFSPAVSVLRWQILGDMLKVASWPLGCVILAAGDGSKFLLGESLAMGVFIAFSVLLTPYLGIDSTGIAFFFMYLFYLPFVYVLAKRRTRFAWKHTVVHLLRLLVVGALSIAFLVAYFPKVGLVVGVLASILIGIYSVNRLAHITSAGGRVEEICSLTRVVCAKIGLKQAFQFSEKG